MGNVVLAEFTDRLAYGTVTEPDNTSTACRAAGVMAKAIAAPVAWRFAGCLAPAGIFLRVERLRHRFVISRRTQPDGEPLPTISPWTATDV
jgi:hypothetical protein